MILDLLFHRVEKYSKCGLVFLYCKIITSSTQKPRLENPEYCIFKFRKLQSTTVVNLNWSALENNPKQSEGRCRGMVCFYPVSQHSDGGKENHNIIQQQKEYILAGRRKCILFYYWLLKYGIEFPIIKDPETSKFISQLIHNWENKYCDRYYRTSNLIPFLKFCCVQNH